MNRDNYTHALNELKNKRKEFEIEIKFVDEEINLLKKDYINRNAQFKKGDTVMFQNKIYEINHIDLSPISLLFIYNIKSIEITYHSPRNLHLIYEKNLELVERNNND